MQLQHFLNYFAIEHKLSLTSKLFNEHIHFMPSKIFHFVPQAAAVQK